MNVEEAERTAVRLMGQADHLRPPLQALLDVVLAAAKTGSAMRASSDEIWATTAVSVAEGLGLDLDKPGGIRTACLIAELVMLQSGVES
jgi:hypothetical protein